MTNINTIIVPYPQSNERSYFLTKVKSSALFKARTAISIKSENALSYEVYSTLSNTYLRKKMIKIA